MFLRTVRGWMLAVAVVALLISPIGRRGYYARIKPVRAGIIAMTSFGPNATSPGDPNDGCDGVQYVWGRWIVYAGVDRYRY